MRPPTIETAGPAADSPVLSDLRTPSQTLPPILPHAIMRRADFAMMRNAHEEGPMSGRTLRVRYPGISSSSLKLWEPGALLGR
jgi:hypothetical protein